MSADNTRTRLGLRMERIWKILKRKRFQNSTAHCDETEGSDHGQFQGHIPAFRIE